MTESEYKALTILASCGERGVPPGVFARCMWPDSSSWRRTSRCGPRGATTGTGIRRCAGSYLSRLAEKGWAYECLSMYGYAVYRLAPAGREALEIEEARRARRN